MLKRVLGHLSAPTPLLLLLPLMLVQCGTGDNLELDLTVTPTHDSNAVAEDSGTYLLLNQRYLEGIASSPIDLEDVDAVFWHIFSKLPSEVTIFPSENYYYFIMYVEGKQLWGNIRLAAGRRERGVLSFAYFEFKESPLQVGTRLTRSKYFTKADGLSIEEIDRFTYLVGYDNKEVTFHLHQLSQDPPNLFSFAPVGLCRGMC